MRMTNNIISFYANSNIVLFRFATVVAMRSIASKLQYSNWRIADDSCSRGFGLNNTVTFDEDGLMDFGSNVTCNCTATVCHISRMYEYAYHYT
ncbi:hypothetical protein Hanom_Chr11g00984071 [Helianthus anomalus]